MESSDVLTLISQIEQQQTMDLDLLSKFIKSVATRNIDINYVEQWLKAVHSNGISVDETTILTKGMMESGSMIAWEDNTLVVDKHSTGGVGDKNVANACACFSSMWTQSSDASGSRTRTYWRNY
jgi:thymidine phosphorylase